MIKPFPRGGIIRGPGKPMQDPPCCIIPQAVLPKRDGTLRAITVVLDGSDMLAGLRREMGKL